MLPPLQYSALGLETFGAEVLHRAAIVAEAPVAALVWQPKPGRPAGWKEASRASYRPVAPGFRWGPAWSTAWFRATGRVPESMRGRTIWLRFSSGTEATAWQAGVPVQGLDPYRDLVLLRDRSGRPARTGDDITVQVEAACNIPLGVSTFWWDHPEIHARWKEAKPGRLEACQLVAFDPDLQRFARTWDLLRTTLLALPADSPRAVALNDGLRDIARRIDGAAPAEGMRASAAALDALRRGAGESRGARTTCVAVGHAHIDTAWLWPLRETRRKCVRTFASVLRLMERFERFRFTCSQAQQYAWIEEDAPALFREITARVKDGRWEPAGAMWVEPDCTCPSGESFIRQILHGTRYWRERFGDHAAQRFAYLPDTFGFPPCMPQVFRLAGLDTFITNKMSWSETNRFPHVTFRWKGLDGSDVLTHLTPGHNYNSSIEAADLLHGERNLLSQDGQSFVGRALPLWLQPFGYGDGGGGPTEAQIVRAELARDCEGLPDVEQDTVARFCQRLHTAEAELARRERALATWDGELYLELHRGTYTSQAWIKRQNRFAESALRDVEAFGCSLPDATDRDRSALRATLDPLWKLVLLNQFHDILPGSSIAAVYDDARRDHVEVAAVAGDERQRLLAAIADAAVRRDFARPVLVRNPASTTRSAVIEVHGEPVAVDAVPALGFAIIDAAVHRLDGPGVTVKRAGRGATLANAWLEVAIDRAGRIGDIRVHGLDRSANARDGRGRLRPMNQLILYEDRPRRWEAWDIDRDVREKPRLVDDDATIEIVNAHRLRCEVRVERALGRASRMWQTYRLDAQARHLEIATQVEWREERTLLRALFPVDVRAAHATFGTQFGHLERATHRNTSWEEARFEVPGHAWMDLSEPGLGVAILDDGKYGRSVEADTLGLSLLRAPNFPDPGADRGEHAFTYAVMLHDGDWRGAGVDAEAEALREPLHALALRRRARRPRGGAADAAQSSWAPFKLEVPEHLGIQIAAWKPAEDGRGRVLRLVETRGGRGDVTVRWSGAATSVVAVDVLERRLASDSALAPERLHHDRRAAATTFRMRPFQIVTLLIRET